MFIHCPGRYFSYKTEKFKETANRGIKDYGSVAPLIGVHEVISKVPSTNIGYVDLSLSQVKKEYPVGSEDLGNIPLMDFSFNEGISQVTDLIMYDTTYFIYILDSKSINLVLFSAEKFGQVYTSNDIAKKVYNNSNIYKIKGYSTGDYTISDDYKYFFLTCEVDDETGNNFIRKY